MVFFDTEGWKRFRHPNTPIYQFGIRFPRSSTEARILARILDDTNGNTKWTDAMTLEMTQHRLYSTFLSKGKDGVPPPGYKRIRVY